MGDSHADDTIKPIRLLEDVDQWDQYVPDTSRKRSENLNPLLPCKLDMAHHEEWDRNDNDLGDDVECIDRI